MHDSRDFFDAKLGSRCNFFSDRETLKLAIGCDFCRLADVFAIRIVKKRDLIVDSDSLHNSRDQRSGS